MSRLSLSDADRSARDWFAETTKSLGCKITIDNMGNMFAVRPGKRHGPPTCAGSHLDTQPAGGRYDGILGVCAGLEMLRTLDEQKIETEYPVGVINWTNEEGARFPASMVASQVWAGQIPLQQAHDLREASGERRTMKQELEEIGYLGDVDASAEAMPIAAHFELHIEQGPILEASRKKIGIVQGVQAYRWYSMAMHGRSSHTGTTPFSNRSDALLAASHFVTESYLTASRLGSLASTGIMSTLPGSVNTTAGRVNFSLDLRAPTNEELDKLESELKSMQTLREGAGRGCTLEWKTDTISPAIRFHEDCINCVEQSAGNLVGESELGALTERMRSGAGHDSVSTSYKVPTSMIFVPCRDGVSHNPREFCAEDDCGNGTQVLMGAVLRYDKLRAARAS
ncbi:hypothetical protein MMC25_006966 [Agyrium rufum]|nr:hypothetical protein [Agyrium rufum]